MLVMLAGCARVAVRIRCALVHLRVWPSFWLDNSIVEEHVLPLVLNGPLLCVGYVWLLVLVVADFSWNNLRAILPVRSNMFTRVAVLRKANNCAEVVSGFLYPEYSTSPSEGCFWGLELEHP
jgi:hypothetical protein